MVDLAVGRFELSGGTHSNTNSASQPLNVQGDNLRVQLAFSVLKQSYQGEVSLQPIYVMNGRQTPVVITLTAPLIVERDRIAVQNASVRTATSELTLSAALSPT